MAGELKNRPSKEILPLGDLSELIVRSQTSNDSWDLKKRISSGSFGDVYAAVSEWNEEVAIKIEHVKKDNFYSYLLILVFHQVLCFRD